MTDINDIIFARKPMKYDHKDFRLSEYITPAMRRTAESIVATDWKISKILDQGSTPHCVGFAWAGFGLSHPVEDEWDNRTGDQIYYAAKILDGEEGQENGSNTRSGVQAFMQFGQLEGDSYAFANSMDDIIIWLLTMGPVVTGTYWYSDMMYPEPSGLVNVTGRIIGGHEWMISGVDKVNKVFHCTNSWGTEWGKSGQFYLTFSDYEILFNDEGDAVTTAEAALTPIPVPVPVPPEEKKLSSILNDLYQWSVDNNK